MYVSICCNKGKLHIFGKHLHFHTHANSLNKKNVKHIIKFMLKIPVCAQIKRHSCVVHKF